MSHIIGKNCISICDTGCVDVCPVDCIHGPIEKKNSGREIQDLKKNNEFHSINNPQLYINPIECINCGACIVECPVDAIYHSEFDAIENGDGTSVINNYKFFDLDYKKYKC